MQQLDFIFNFIGQRLVDSVLSNTYNITFAITMHKYDILLHTLLKNRVLALNIAT